jgi:hypothetical protein
MQQMKRPAESGDTGKEMQRILDAMDLHQDNAEDQRLACRELVKLMRLMRDSSDPHALFASMLTARAHERIIRALGLHQDNVRVQVDAMIVLRMLAFTLSRVPGATRTLAQAATAQIVRTMRRTMRLHPTEDELILEACEALMFMVVFTVESDDIVNDIMMRAGADVALIELAYREWAKKATRVAEHENATRVLANLLVCPEGQDPYGLITDIPPVGFGCRTDAECQWNRNFGGRAHYILSTLAGNPEEEGRDQCSWSVLFDRLRQKRIELLGLLPLSS